MLGPAPAVISRVNRKYRWHIIVKCEKDQDPSGLAMRRVLQGALRRQEEHPRRGVQVIVDMDPAGLM
jgi:primosomal protein N'